MNVPIIKRKKKKKESCPHNLHLAKYLQTHKHDCKRSDQSVVIKSTDAFWACVSSSSVFGGSNDRSYLVIHSLLFVACFWTFVSHLTAAAAFRHMHVHVTHSNTVRAEIEIFWHHWFPDTPFSETSEFWSLCFSVYKRCLTGGQSKTENGAKSTEPGEQNPLEEAMFTVSLSPNVTHSPTVYIINAHTLDKKENHVKVFHLLSLSLSPGFSPQQKSFVPLIPSRPGLMKRAAVGEVFL